MPEVPEFERPPPDVLEEILASALKCPSCDNLIAQMGSIRDVKIYVCPACGPYGEDSKDLDKEIATLLYMGFQSGHIKGVPSPIPEDWTTPQSEDSPD